MLPDRRSAFEDAPLADLLALLLRQYRRPLASRGIELTDADAERIAQRIIARDAAETSALRDALAALVTESEAVLARWNLTFQQSLGAQMTDIPGWETTAEFLEIANEKANAELRISTGAALLVALGDARYTADLRYVAAHSEDDLDRIIAGRVLQFEDEKNI